MIIRTPKKVRFTVISNAVIEDQRLTWAATGLLIYLLSKPDNWRIQPAHLIKERQLGRDGIYRLLKELETAGYMRKRQVKNHAGRMVGTDWFVFDEPQPAAPGPENPDTGKPHPELPHPVNPPLTNTDLSTKTEINKYTHSNAQPKLQPSAPNQPPCVCMSSLSGVEREREERPDSVESVESVESVAPVAPVELVKLVEPVAPMEPVALVVPVVYREAPPVAQFLSDTAVTPAPAPAHDHPPLLSEHRAEGKSETVDTPPAAPAHPRPAQPSPRKPTVAPLDAHEQEALAWAQQHSFWHSRITNPENLRRNLQPGKAFRAQFLGAKALASDATTDQGLAGDLLQNHPVYRGYDHAESYRHFQSPQPAGDTGPGRPEHAACAAAGERQRKLCPAEAARLAEQRLLQRLDRERAERARTVAGERLAAEELDAVYYRPPVAADGGHLQPSMDRQLW